MTIQWSDAVRNARADAIEATIGTAPIFQVRTGAQAANCAASAAGSLLCAFSCPSDWMAAASAGLKVKSGTWSGTASAAGLAGHYRILNSAGSTCHEHGKISMAFPLTTSSGSSAGTNTLTFAATTGVVAGMGVFGTNIPVGAKVLGTPSGTVVTLDVIIPAGGIASSAVILFGDVSGDFFLPNTTIANLDSVVVTAKSYLEAGA